MAAAKIKNTIQGLRNWEATTMVDDLHHDLVQLVLEKKSIYQGRTATGLPYEEALHRYWVSKKQQKAPE
jgi:hypothetical protein